MKKDYFTKHPFEFGCFGYQLVGFSIDFFLGELETRWDTETKTCGCCEARKVAACWGKKSSNVCEVGRSKKRLHQKSMGKNGKKHP